MQSRRTVTGGVRRPPWALTALLAMALGVAVLATGCTPAEEPVRDAREALGTVVTITAYGEDAAQVEMAVEDAYAAMAEVERALNVYGETGAPCGSAASLNLMPHEWNPLPEEAQEVLARTAELDVGGQFSPGLFGVQELYDFEGGGRVPDAEELAPAVEAATTFETREADGIVDGRFTPQGGAETTTSAEAVPVGVDFGGAAKGLGLDRAAAALRESGAVDAAVISAGSTTIAFGEKPDGSPWKIGIEDPRDPEVVVSVVEGPGDVIVSTSGDYQRYFEEAGERYHHILDPATGEPARGTQSLTVVGTSTGLDSDILSTALFVMGPEEAAAYAKQAGLGLYVIDSEGRTQIAPGPDDSYSFAEVE